MIAVEQQGVVTVVAPDLPLNAEHVEELEEAATGQLPPGLPMVVLDLSSVPLLDSVGLTALLDIRDNLRGRGGVVKVSGPTPLVADILEATGVGDHFETFDNIKSAIGSFSR